jgi:hypothetical protein
MAAALKNAASASTLVRFQRTVSHLRSLLDDIEREVTATIDSRDPDAVSSKQAPRPSAELLTAYRKFGIASDELAGFASDPSDYVTLIAGGFHESNALLVVSELAVADVLGDKQLPLNDIASKVDADPVRLRTFCPASISFLLSF